MSDRTFYPLSRFRMKYIDGICVCQMFFLSCLLVCLGFACFVIVAWCLCLILLGFVSFVFVVILCFFLFAKEVFLRKIQMPNSFCLSF